MIQKNSWIGPPSGRAYKELAELVRLMRRAKMADETTPPDYPSAQYEPKQAYEQANMVRASGMHLGDLRVPKVRTVVLAQIQELEKQLSERRDLLKQLDENPGTEKLLDTMRRLGV